MRSDQPMYAWPLSTALPWPPRIGYRTVRGRIQMRTILAGLALSGLLRKEHNVALPRGPKQVGSRRMY
jgi:hypothetical protein